MGKIFYVMGKSSSGKDTIYNMLINDRDLKLDTIVGYTTRPMRENEESGREYFFVNEDDLNALEKKGKVIEKRGYSTIYGMWYYFTVDDGNILDNNNYVLIGTLESYEKIRKYYGEKSVIPLYIDVEDGERLIRAINREKLQTVPKYEEMCRRFLADQKDFSAENLSRLGIDRKFNNQILDECYSYIKRYIQSVEDHNFRI